MAAIAYVTDENMLEYHRLNGSHSIAFWRLSSKKFSDFKPGDLLFFLARDFNGPRREKGLSGYGQFVTDTSLTISSMWNRYKQATGYGSREELEDAVIKSCKSETLPEKIGCLLLDKVVFFQSPIYLSDLGYKVPNKLESFMYLDKNNGAQTLKILSAARKVGLSSWSLMANENISEDLFEQQLLKYNIATVLENYDLHRLMNEKTAAHICSEISGVEWVDSRHCFLISYEPETVFFLFDSSAKRKNENFFWALGMLASLRIELDRVLDTEVGIKMISRIPMTENEKVLLEQNRIGLIEG